MRISSGFQNISEKIFRLYLLGPCCWIFKIRVVATNTPLKSPKVSDLRLGWSYLSGGPWFGGCIS